MRNRIVAFMFSWFLGGFGINNFYTGHIALGVLDIIFCWTCIPAVINFIRGILYLCCSSDEEFNTKYVK